MRFSKRGAANSVFATGTVLAGLAVTSPGLTQTTAPGTATAEPPPPPATLPPPAAPAGAAPATPAPSTTAAPPAPAAAPVAAAPQPPNQVPASKPPPEPSTGFQMALRFGLSFPIGDATGRA